MRRFDFVIFVIYEYFYLETIRTNKHKCLNSSGFFSSWFLSQPRLRTIAFAVDQSIGLVLFEHGHVKYATFIFTET